MSVLTGHHGSLTVHAACKAHSFCHKHWHACNLPDGTQNRCHAHNQALLMHHASRSPWRAHSRPDRARSNLVGWIISASWQLPPHQSSITSVSRCCLTQGPTNRYLLKFRRVTIRGAQPSARLSELSQGSAGVSQRALRRLCGVSPGALRGSAGVRRIFRGFSGVVTLCL